VEEDRQKRSGSLNRESSELLIGCGLNLKKRFKTPNGEDWNNLITLDFNEDVNPGIVWDLNNIPLPFDNNSFDEIHAYHVLEHCGRQGDYKYFFDQFNDFWRILKPGGCFCGVVPQRNDVWTWGDPGHTRVINDGTICFLDQKRYEKCGETSMTDYRFCYHGDFEIIGHNITEDDYYFILKARKK
jgi:SAM-dependent methyltransferase